MRILGLDPGLRHTGWGIIDVAGSHLRHVADGAVDSDASQEVAQRLLQIFEGVAAVISEYTPEQAAVEKTFVNRNPASALKLGQARGIALLAPAQAGLSVAEYAPNLVKKSVVGSGHAAKEQVAMMVITLLPGSSATADAADALAVAICHAHHAATTLLQQERDLAGECL
jgi:crossover junction endodeoxyribonuclease RuvC